MRWGLGPVFLYECLANSRRWQTYGLRSAGVALLLAAIATIAMSHPVIDPRYAWRQYAALGESYFYAIIGVELTLVLLAAPAATAGAICVDRARGTLAHMLATELSDGEIVLGKLAARLLPVLGLVACSWPVLAISSLLGGIDPIALALAFAIILAVALLGCAMALALSVWARKPHEVVMVVYTSWMIALLLWPVWWVLSVGVGIVGRPPAWTLLADPYYLAFAPYSAPGRLQLWDYLTFFAAALGASAVLSGLAVWRMRPVARRGTDEHRKEPGLGLLGRLTRRLPGPSLDGNPVLWREWHRARPSRWLMVLVVLIGGSTTVAWLVGAVMVWETRLTPGTPNPGVIIGVGGFLLQLGFGLLVLSAAAPMAMSEERQRGSLDLLAATTLSTPTIVLGKWLATLRPAALLAIGPGLLGFIMATADSTARILPPGIHPRYAATVSRGALLYAAGLLVATVLVHGALIASIGLALAVWIARQGRAIALSVGIVVTLGAGWPFLCVAGPGGGLMGWGPANLSPVVAVSNLVEVVTTRLGYEAPDILWSVTFWDLECLVLALGLLWLTVRTFDGCLGRIPERPRRVPILSDVVLVLAVVLGVGGLFGAIATWSRRPTDFRDATENYGVMANILLVAVAFHLLAALAASSMSRGGPLPSPDPGPAAAIPGRRLFASRWWVAFRLVLLLAIGPALIALAVATTPRPIKVVTKATPLPKGGTVKIETDPDGDTLVITTDASGVRTLRAATAAEIAEAGLMPQTRDIPRDLGLAALAAGTILAHGAAYVSLGLALGVWIRRRDRAIAASAGLVLFLTEIWPVFYVSLFHYPGAPWGCALSSVIPAYSALVFSIRRPQTISPDVARWAAEWDAALILAAVIVSGLAIRALDRRRRGSPSSRSLPVASRGATMAGDDPGGALEPSKGLEPALQPDRVGSSGWKA
jgi:ABC-type transport system involved in multi-copper enzyme maturation permease subunit